MPLRIEVGPKDVKAGQVTTVRRDTSAREGVKSDAVLGESIKAILATMQKDMLARATEERDKHVPVVDKWEEVVPQLDALNMVLVPWCERIACEEDIKANSNREQGEEIDQTVSSMGAKSLCIPFEQPKKLAPGQKCVRCDHEAKSFGLFGRSY